MTTTTSEVPSGVLVPVTDPLFTVAERQALGGFLSCYSGLTRDAYTLDLRMYTWVPAGGQATSAPRGAPSTDCTCSTPSASTFRPSAATWKPADGHERPWPAGSAPSPGSTATPKRKNSSHVHRPRTCAVRGWTTNPTRQRWTATNSAACSSPPASAPPKKHTLMSLLALNGLRISEALSADITAMGNERGHRTLTILRKGGKIVTIPLAPRTARSLDLAIGERLDGPIFLRPDGQRLDRHGAGRIVRRIAKRAGINKQISPHTLRHAMHLIQAGVNLIRIRDLLGHADIATIEIYAHADTKRTAIENAYEPLTPDVLPD